MDTEPRARCRYAGKGLIVVDYASRAGRPGHVVLPGLDLAYTAAKFAARRITKVGAVE